MIQKSRFLFVSNDTLIGMSYQFTTTKVVKVASTAFAEAFGITLESAGGSVPPTLEQLYTLGKV
jgi:hypothetical protein